MHISPDKVLVNRPSTVPNERTSEPLAVKIDDFVEGWYAFVLEQLGVQFIRVVHTRILDIRQTNTTGRDTTIVVNSSCKLVSSVIRVITIEGA